MYVFKLFLIWKASILILIVTEVTSINVGTILFNKKIIRRECWSQLDLAKLRARQVFEKLAVPCPPPESLDESYIKNILQYYKRAVRVTQTELDVQTKTILKDSLEDMIGGHLRYEILPTSRIAYYAGYLPYRSVRSLHDYLEDLKRNLNTQGIGWKTPPKIPRWSNITVAKVLITHSNFFNPCTKLILKRDSNSCIHLPLPKFDNKHNPTAMALPFKRNGLISLTSSDSENILLKYYTLASKCILKNSPAKCRHSDFLAYNRELWHWMKRDVAPHLMDEQLFTAYSGVLRVAAAVQSYGKGLSRRNLFEEEESYGYPDVAGSVILNPWKYLSQSYTYMDTDWTPLIYVVLVIIAALAIYLLQICQHYIFSGSRNCHCSGASKKSGKSRCGTTEVVYSSVDSNIPAILPVHPQSAVYISDKKRISRQSSKNKAASLASFKTQKVYDLNENTEKMMAIIMSDNEDRDSVGATIPPSIREESSDESLETSKEISTLKRSKSPPKIEPHVSQLRLEKTPRLNQVRIPKMDIPMFSTTESVSRSEMTFPREVVTESAWSGTESSSSDGSSTSKTRSRRRRSSRDLAWARRVMTKQSSQDYTIKSTSTIEDSTVTPSTKR